MLPLDHRIFTYLLGLTERRAFLIKLHVAAAIYTLPMHLIQTAGEISFMLLLNHKLQTFRKKMLAAHSTLCIIESITSSVGLAEA